MPNAVISLILALAVAALAPLADAAAPQRIASLNLCTDQLLLMLVARERIASVSDWATHPESSYMAEAARGIPTNRGAVETVLSTRPDLILAGEYTDTLLLQALKRLGYRVETLAVPQNLAQARTYILRFGELVGETAKAQRIVEDMDLRLRHIDREVRIDDRAAHALGRDAHANSHTDRRRKKLAAAYAPNGMTVGRGAVLTEIIERAGWRNLGSELPIRGYGAISLERLLAAQPDLLVLDITATGHDDSIAHSYLSHPALTTLKQTARTVVVPPRLSECVGPMTVDAIELVAAQR